MPTPPPPPRRAAAVALVAVLLLGLGACSSSEGAEPTGRTTTGSSTTTTATGAPDTVDDDVADATEADYVEALVTNFSRSGDVFDAKGVRCLAEHFVGAIGADTFREATVTPDDLARNRADLDRLEIDRATAEDLADAFDRCGLQLRDAYLKTLEGNLSEQGKVCVDELLTEDVVRKAFVADLLGEELDPDPLTQVERCTR